MSGYYGLIELLLVFGIVFGLGIWQLYSVRRDTRRAGDGAGGSKAAEDTSRGSAVRRKSEGIER